MKRHTLFIALLMSACLLFASSALFARESYSELRSEPHSEPHSKTLRGSVANKANAYKSELLRESRYYLGLNAPIALFAAQIHAESLWNEKATSPVHVVWCFSLQSLVMVIRKII